MRSVNTPSGVTPDGYASCSIAYAVVAIDAPAPSYPGSSRPSRSATTSEASTVPAVYGDPVTCSAPAAVYLVAITYGWMTSAQVTSSATATGVLFHRIRTSSQSRVFAKSVVITFGAEAQPPVAHPSSPPFAPPAG